MSEHTTIAWTNATANFWVGCTEVSAACDNCYARILAARFGRAEWGGGKPRMRTSERTWMAPYRWDRAAAKSGKPTRVFCQSMSDFFDNEVDPTWRVAAWKIIRDTPHLRWQLLTKRIGNVQKMLPLDWESVRYAHVGIMATIANQEEANRDIPKLMTLKFEREVRWVGISVEPMLGPIDLTDIRFREEDCDIKYDVLSGEAWVLNSDSPSRYSDDNPTLDWVIVGGESGKGSNIRTFELEHASALLDQCQRTGVAAFFKQMGSKPTLAGEPIKFPHWKGENPDEWPAEFQIQQFPRALQ